MQNGGNRKFGVGLFIVRQEAERDLFSVLEKMRDIGYHGVELLGFFGKRPDEIRKRLDALGITALGNHVGLDDFEKEPDRIIADHMALGCAYLTIGWGKRGLTPGTTEFDEALRATRKLARRCVDAGITPLYHNHGYDFPRVDAILDGCREDGLCFEPDIGWMVFAGVDPAVYLKKYSEFCPVIHFKDVYADDMTKLGDGFSVGTVKNDPALGGFSFRPTGYGLVNFARLLPLCLACRPDWLMVDHDLAYDRDSFSDLQLSLDYLKNLLRVAE